MSSHLPYDPGGNQQPTGGIYIRIDQQPNNTRDSLAIQEGYNPGYERIEFIRTDTDGAQSLSYSVNNVLPQQGIQRHVCQPEVAIALSQATGREEIIQRQLNGNHASRISSSRENNVEQQGVHAEETHLPGNHTTPQHFPTGFNSVNQHRHEQMVSLPPQAPTSVTQHHQPENSVSASGSEAASNINADNNSKFEKCKLSLINAGFGEEEARKFAIRGICSINVGKMLKCLKCNKTFDMDHEQHYRHDCFVMGNTRNSQGASLSDEHLGATRYKAPVAQASLLVSSREYDSSRAARQQPPPVNNQSGLSSNVPPAKLPTAKQPTQNEADIKARLKGFGYTEVRIEAVIREHGPKAMETLEEFMACDSATPSTNMASYEEACRQTSDLFQTALYTSVPMAMDQRSGNTPESRQYRSYGARRSTFDNPPWPKFSMQSPDDLARAGFYYKGKDDEVRCFACGVLLRRWQVQDNPWFEHARNRPECSYVLAEKGEDYVKAAMRS